MTTQLNSTVPSRDAAYQLVHYLRKAINVAQTTSGTAVTVGTIPTSAIVLSGSGIYVTTDFNSTTNAVNVGYATDALGSAVSTAYASALTLVTTTGGFTTFNNQALNGARPRAIDTTVTATWTGSATTGVFEVVIWYVPNR